MSEWYYTDFSGKRHGPFAGEELIALNDSGEVYADTRVWREGLQEWEPLRQHAASLFGTDEDGNLSETGVCAHSGRVVKREDMIPYGEALIALVAKQDFVQSLMETGRTMVTDATETGVRYAGFWWRFLAVILDEMVKWVPNSVFTMIPPMVLYFVTGRVSENVANIVIASTYFLAMLLMLLFSIFYETWMVGKYQATVGKMVIGAKIVNPDGTRLTYKRSFIRWAAKNPLAWTITSLPPLLIFILLMVAIAAGLENSDRPGIVFTTIFFATMIAILLTGVFSSVFWMAAFDSEKRTLHDRIASTRVVKK